jgi:hypothetical protein
VFGTADFSDARRWHPKVSPYVALIVAAAGGTRMTDSSSDREARPAPREQATPRRIKRPVNLSIEQAARLADLLSLAGDEDDEDRGDDGDGPQRPLPGQPNPGLRLDASWKHAAMIG